jgi:hypothetical protein
VRLQIYSKLCIKTFEQADMPDAASISKLGVPDKWLKQYETCQLCLDRMEAADVEKVWLWVKS